MGDYICILYIAIIDHAEKGRNRPDVLVLMENDGDDPLHEAIEQVYFEQKKTRILESIAIYIFVFKE